MSGSGVAVDVAVFREKEDACWMTARVFILAETSERGTKLRIRDV